MPDRQSRAGFEFLDDHGCPVTVEHGDDAPGLFAQRPSVLPRWLDPRTSGSRAVLWCLLVVFAACIVTVRHQRQSDIGPPPAPPGPTLHADPFDAVPEPVLADSFRDGSRWRLTGTARSAAKVLDWVGQRASVMPFGDSSCSPGRRSAVAQARLAAAVHSYLPDYTVVTTSSGWGTRGQLCKLVLWAQHRWVSLAVCIAAPGRSSRLHGLRWQLLNSRGDTLEWVRNTNAARWTVFIASVGPTRVPGLATLVQLAQDSRMSW